MCCTAPGSSLGNFITGPYAAMLLGELGADVIKIERRDAGDPFRAFKDGLYSPQFQSHKKAMRPPPDLGEHTDEVLREIGKSAREIDELRKKGVI